MSSGVTAGFHRANLVRPMLCVQQFVQWLCKWLYWLVCGVYSGFKQWYNRTLHSEIAGQSNGQFTGQCRRMAVGAGYNGLNFFFFFFEKIACFLKVNMLR